MDCGGGVGTGGVVVAVPGAVEEAELVELEEPSESRDFVRSSVKGPASRCCSRRLEDSGGGRVTPNAHTSCWTVSLFAGISKARVGLAASDYRSRSAFMFTLFTFGGVVAHQVCEGREPRSPRWRCQRCRLHMSWSLTV